MRKLFTLSAAVLCSMCAVAQTTDVRLISQSDFLFNGGGFGNDDSTVYSYNGANGYDDLTKHWKYDSSATWYFDNSTTSWANNSKVYQQLSNGRIMNRTERVYVGGTWKDNTEVAYTYKNDLIETNRYSFNMGAGLQPMAKDSNIYNTAKQLTETIMLSWNNVSGSWNNGSRKSFHYNSSGKVDTIWSATWTGTAWNIDGRIIYMYTAGMHTSTLEQFMSPSGWVNDTRTTSTYNSQNLVATSVVEAWDVVTSAWVNSQRFEYDYNAAGDRIEQRFAGWTSATWQYSDKWVYTYNSNHRILTEQTYSWNPGAGAWYQEVGVDRYQRNIYESYTVDVKTVVNNIADLEVFPVPAADKIHIAASFRQSQPVVVSLLDMTGKLVKQITAPAGTQHRHSIDVSDLAAGNYIIKLSGTTEQAAKTITISH